MIETSARLIAVDYVGSLGAAVRKETETQILCTLGSVNRTEFFAAFNSGFAPEWRVTTNPVNWTGQRIIDLDTPEGTVRCDIYRTYIKSRDVIELWCTRQNAESVQTFTLWTAGRKIMLYGAYLTGSDGADRTTTGQVATDQVTLILPQTLQAFAGATPVAYCRPKAYAAMSAQNKATHFCIETGDFFALGAFPTVDGTAKYQAVNAAYDDVWRVQSVNRRTTAGAHRGTPDKEYIEVIGR